MPFSSVSAEPPMVAAYSVRLCAEDLSMARRDSAMASSARPTRIPAEMRWRRLLASTKLFMWLPLTTDQRCLISS